MRDWLAEHIACPRDGQKLELRDDTLTCGAGHSYAVVDDIPVLLVDDAESTHDYIQQTLEVVKEFRTTGQIEGVPATAPENGSVDGFVQAEVPYTSGHLYLPVQNKLPRYPIPETRLSQGHGERLLDIGCNWGRWSIAAGRKGYKPVGLDPSLKAVLAAKRICDQLGIEADFVAGDARFLPFDEGAFDTVFSYGVFQHMSKDVVRSALDEIARVVKTEGTVLVQMSNRNGIRQYQQHRRRGFTEGEGFEIRYWTPGELIETFEKRFGPTAMTTDCFFGLGIQGADADLLPLKYRSIIYASEALRKVSHFVTGLTRFADSVYLSSINENKGLKHL